MLGWFAGSGFRSAWRFAGFGIAALLVPVAAAVAAEGEAERPFIPFTPLQIALVTNAQMLPRNVPVWGVSVNAIYGVQDHVYGLDVGLLNEVSEDLVGAGIGVVNISRGNAAGLHAGVGNAAEGGFTGLQLGAVNYVEGDFKGAQLGAGNTSGTISGVQLGIFNQTESLEGVQIGLLNFNSKGPLWFFPLINVGF